MQLIHAWYSFFFRVGTRVTQRLRRANHATATFAVLAMAPGSRVAQGYGSSGVLFALLDCVLASVTDVRLHRRLSFQVPPSVVLAYASRRHRQSPT